MSKSPSFEESITALEQMITHLEQGELSLDESLKQYEKGIQLARLCEGLLTKAEQKIIKISQKNGVSEYDGLDD